MWVNSYIITWIFFLVMEKPKDWKCSHAPYSPKISANPSKPTRPGSLRTPLSVWWRDFRDLPDAPFLEDHPRMKDTYFRTMVIGFRPLRVGIPSPSKWAIFMAEINGGDPNQLHPLGWSSKFLAPFSHGNSPHAHEQRPIQHCFWMRRSNTSPLWSLWSLRS